MPGTNDGGKPKPSIRDYLLGGGGLVVLVSIATLAFNQLRTQEELKNAQQDLLLTQQDLKLTQQGQFSERYAHAIEELGSDRLPIRLTGIYELEQVALASPDHYQLGMEILADYLRTVSLVPGGARAGTPTPPDADETAEIRAILKVLGRRPKDREPVRLDLSGVNLRALDLAGADLSGDDFSGADFGGANLTRADLRGADLSDANLMRAIFRGADLAGADLSTANLTKAQLSGTDLTEANLYYANLTEANLFDANLAGADLGLADLTEALLNETDLTAASLFRANLTEARLSSADLTDANLSRADLRDANLTGTNLLGANLSGANLTGADLRNVQNLTQEQLDAAVTNEDTLLPSELGTPARPPFPLASPPGSGTPSPPLLLAP